MNKVQKKQRKAVLGGKAKPMGLLRNWVHQGFFYLDNTERIGRVLLEIIPVIFIYYVISLAFGAGNFDYSKLITALLINHTFNWIFNDNWWACVIFAFPKLENPGVKKTRDYLKNMQTRLSSDITITGAMIYGSVARKMWHNRSDLDIRILRKKGLCNGVIAYQVLLRERFRAVFARQPLDIYLADDVGFLKKLRKDEYPIFLKMQDDRLKYMYPMAIEVEDFSLYIK